MRTQKRRHKRYRIDGMDIHAKTVFSAAVELINISMTGAYLQTSHKLRIGCNYLLWLNNEGIFLPLMCTVKRQLSSATTPEQSRQGASVYKAGIEFLDSDAETSAKLRDFIGRHKLSREQQFAFEKRFDRMRYKLPERTTAHLNYEEIHAVKNISLCGMLIETKYKLGLDKSIPMELYLPNEVPIKFVGRIASCIISTDAYQKPVNTGIEFFDMPEPDKSRLSRFITLREAHVQR